MGGDPSGQRGAGRVCSWAVAVGRLLPAHSGSVLKGPGLLRAAPRCPALCTVGDRGLPTGLATVGPSSTHPSPAPWSLESGAGYGDRGGRGPQLRDLPAPPGWSLCSDPDSLWAPTLARPLLQGASLPRLRTGPGPHDSLALLAGWRARRAGQTWSCLFLATARGHPRAGGGGGGFRGPGWSWESTSPRSWGAASPLSTRACHPPQRQDLITLRAASRGRQNVLLLPGPNLCSPRTAAWEASAAVLGGAPEASSDPSAHHAPDPWALGLLGVQGLGLRLQWSPVPGTGSQLPHRSGQLGHRRPRPTGKCLC